MTTKILALTDAGQPGALPPDANRYDSVDVPPLIEGVAFEGLIADKAFDSNALVAELDERGVKIVISQHPARAQKLKIDASMAEVLTFQPTIRRAKASITKAT